jgi:DNA-binding NtrC family response regulator
MISATSKERVHKMDDEKKNNILIVDDEPSIIESLSILFSSDGYNVFESDNVDGAQNIMRRHDIDAVITDLKMPESSVCIHYRKLSRHSSCFYNGIWNS